VKSWRLTAVVLAAAGLITIFYLARGSNGTAETKVPDQMNGAPRLLAVDPQGAIVQSPDQTWGIARQGGEVVWKVGADEFLPLIGSCDPSCPSGVLSTDTNGLGSPLAEDPVPLTQDAVLPDEFSESTGGKLMLFDVGRGVGLRYSTDADGRAVWSSLRGGALDEYPARVGYVDWFPVSDESAAVTATDSANGRFQQLWVNQGGWTPVGQPVRTDTGFGCTSANGRYSLLDGRRLLARGAVAASLRPLPEWSNCVFTRDRLIVAAYRMADGESRTTISIYGLDGKRISSKTFDAEYFLIADAAGSTYALVGSSEAQIRGPQGQLVTTIPDVQDARFDSQGELVVVAGDGEVRWEDPQAP
jgi:hypothetical protein